jgi:hypothetical protein
MLFRTKDSTIITIDRTTFANDREYYSYIKTEVVGNNVIRKKRSIVDDLVPYINNRTEQSKTNYDRLCKKSV